MPFKKFGFLGNEIENAKQTIRKDFEPLFDLVFEVNEFTLKTVSEVKINNESLQDCLIGTIFAKIIHSFQATVILGQCSLESDYKIILRGLLDSIFVFGAICKNQDFAWEYIKSQKASKLKQINSILDSKPNLFDEKMIEEFKKQRDILKKEKEIENFRSFHSVELAEKAGLSDVYLLAYRLLSIDVHTLPESLDCFLDIDASDKIKSIKLGPKVEGIVDNLCEAIGALLYAVGFLCTIKRMDKEAELIIYKEKLNLIQK